MSTHMHSHKKQITPCKNAAHRVFHLPIHLSSQPRLTISILGLNIFPKSSLDPTISFGIRLTRYAPFCIACCCTAEIPLLVDLKLPAALPGRLPPAGSLIRLGGAKSKAVNVPLLRKSWGEGNTARTSKEEARGVKARTEGE
jgi:hypothetical protein